MKIEIIGDGIEMKGIIGRSKSERVKKEYR